jgi:uncharacterized protein
MVGTQLTVPKHTQPSIAAYWHTLLVLAAILAVTAYGIWAAHSGTYPAPGAERHIIADMYMPAIVYDWALLVLTWLGVRRTIGLRGLIGGRWCNPKQAVLDVLLGVGFWAVWYVVERGVQFLLGPAHHVSINYLFPQGSVEVAVWIFMALTSGFCEEIVFRGYLLKQFSAWTASVPIAVVMQAVLFGAGHSSLGVKQMVVIAVSGALFGLLAVWRNSLRPGMVAHAWADIFGGIIVRGLPYK